MQVREMRSLLDLQLLSHRFPDWRLCNNLHIWKILLFKVQCFLFRQCAFGSIGCKAAKCSFYVLKLSKCRNGVLREQEGEVSKKWRPKLQLFFSLFGYRDVPKADHTVF